MLNKEEILNRIKNAGVVGAGGAGFPAYIKLNSKVEYVLINGAECEPFLQVDQQLLSFFPDKIVKGIKYIQKVTGAKKSIIAVKAKYTNAITALNSILRNEKDIDLFLLDNFYPAGDEQTLVYTVLKRIIPEGGIPLDVGVVVNNVGTVFNIFNAIENNENVVEKFVTVTGEVKKPVTLKVSIGTSFEELIKLAGGITVKDFVVISGGPMMGRIVDYKNEYVTKTTSGIIVLPEENVLIKKKREPIAYSIKMAKTLCIQCNTCTELCPRNALGHSIKPHLLMRKIGFNREINEGFVDAYLCCECGVCGYYACPMGLKPVEVIKFIKGELKKNNIKPSFSKENLRADIFYNYKNLSTDRLISRLDLDKYYHIKAPMSFKLYQPDKVRISLQQHIGAPSVPVVKEGAKVKKGDLIAKIPDNSIGSNIHSSIDGKVINIFKNFIEIKK